MDEEDVSEAKMKIGFYQDHNNEMLNQWTIYDFVFEMRKQGIEYEIYDPRNLVGIETCTAVIFYRCFRHNDILINRLKANGTLIGYSIDDMLWDGPYKERTGIIEQYFLSADFYLLPNEYIAKQIPVKKPTIVRPPALAKEDFDIMYNAPIRSKQTFKIMVSKGHMTPWVFNAIREFVSAMEKEVKTKVVFEYFFSGPDFIQSKNPLLQVVKTRSLKTRTEFFQYLAKSNPDVIVCPLPDDVFHRCKSYPKYLEAGSLGSILIASDVRPYQNCIEHGKNGFLCKTSKDMVKHITDLMQDERGLLNVKRKARDNVYYKHLMPKVGREFHYAFVKFLKKNGCKEEITNIKEEIVPTKVRVNPIDKRVTPPLLRSQVIDISFVCPVGELNSISLIGATYSQIINEPLSYKLMYKGRHIYAGALTAVNLQDNNWWRFQFPKLKLRSQRVTLRIKNTGARPVSFYLGDDTVNQIVQLGDKAVSPLAMKIE